jgi:predicted phosphodiesterase
VRLGVVSDLHGNLLALDAVVAELECDGIDQVVCLGDVSVGPQPSETLARVRELGWPVVMGNWDAAFVDGMPEATNDVARIVNEMNAWWAAQLSDADRELTRGFVPRLELDLDGVRGLFFHGSPRSYDDMIFATTPEDEVRPMLEGAAAPLLVGGHTHVQLLRRYEAGVIVNPGSVGLPFRDWLPREVRIAPWAEYAVLTADDGRLHVDLRRTPFDVEALLDLCRQSGVPHAEWWISCWAR